MLQPSTGKQERQARKLFGKKYSSTAKSGWSRISQRGTAKLHGEALNYYLTIFSQKLHEMEEIRPRVGSRVSGSP